MMPCIHLNAAGAALPLPAAQSASIEFMREEARVGPHWAAAAVKEKVVGIREGAARLLGAPNASNIAFGESATRLWASALGALPIPSGARILVARCEWAGNVLNALKRSRSCGASVEFIPSDAAGRIDLRALAAALDDRVVVVGLPVVSSGLGVRQPVEEVGTLVRSKGCLLFVDAAQAAGREPIRMTSWGADVVVAPARKWLRGPRGQALVGLSDRALALMRDPPLLDQESSAWIAAREWKTRSDARRFESFEFSLAGRIGFGAALSYVEHNLAEIQSSLAAIIRHLRVGLTRIAHVEIFEDERDDTAFLTFLSKRESASSLVERLQHVNVAIATVGLGYARADLEARGLTEICRVAPHAYTTLKEIEHFLEALAPKA